MSKKLIVGVLGVIFILSVVAILIFINIKDETDAIKFKNEYESINDTIRDKDNKKVRSINIPKDNPMLYKNADELVKMIDNNETFVVYFGFSDCPWCRSVLPTLIDVADELKIDKIYYVDVKDIRDVKELDEDGNVKTSKEGTDGYNNLLSRLDSVLSKYTLRNSEGESIDVNEKRIMAPSIVAVKNGVPLSLTSGVSKKQNDAYMDLTMEMETEMHDNIKTVLEDILENNGACEIDQNC